jgi:ABC-type antimicrobial peptide transport system permease subunit
MRKLVWKDIRKNIKLFIGTIVAIMVTVGIIVSCLDLIFASLSEYDYGHRFANVDVVIQHDDQIYIEYWDDDELEQENENVDGPIYLTETEVNDFLNRFDAVADYTFYTSITGYNLSKYSGHNLSSMALSDFYLVEGEKPNSEDVLLDVDFLDKLELSVGDTINIKTRKGYADYRISGSVDSNITDIYKIQNYIFFEEAEAKSLSLGANSVGIITDDIDSVKEYVDDSNYDLFYGAKLNNAEVKDIAVTNQSLFIIFVTMGSICLVISLFVISGTIQFSIKNRVKHFALLRVIGFTKRKINRIIAKQVFIIGFIGGGLGIILSYYMNEIIIYAYQELGIVESTFETEPNYLLASGVVLLVLLLAYVVSISTARKTLSIPPMKAIKQETDMSTNVSGTRIITGGVFLLGGIAILIFTPFKGGIGIGMGFLVVSVSLVGLIGLSPMIMIIINWMLSIFTKRMKSSLGQVAQANVKYKASKFAIAAISIAIIISINGVMLLNNITYINSSIENTYNFVSEYDYMKTNMRADELVDVDYLGIVYSGMVIENNHKVNELSFAGINDTNSIIDVIEGRGIQTTNEIIVDKSLRKFEVGETYNAWTEHGIKTTVTVVGKYESVNQEELFLAVCNSELILNNSYTIEYDVIYTNTQIENSIPNTLETYRDNPSFDIQLAATMLMTLISFLLSIVAIFNTFAIVMTVRKAEFNNLKIIGATKPQIINMTIIETLIVVFTGTVMGLMLLIFTVGKFSKVNTGVFDYIVDNQIFTLLVLISLIVSFIAGYLPSVYTIRNIKQKSRVE